MIKNTFYLLALSALLVAVVFSCAKTGSEPWGQLPKDAVLTLQEAKNCYYQAHEEDPHHPAADDPKQRRAA